MRSRSTTSISLAAAIAVSAVLSAGYGRTVQASAPDVHRHTAASDTPVWAKYNAKRHTVHLIVISAYGQDTYNFNGGSKGQFKFTVPVHSKVVVTYSNDSPMMLHGFEIVKWTGTLPTDTVPSPAFPGAASPNYRHGTPQGVTQIITFTASKAGKYLMICPVHNHVKFGHWDWFIVSRKAKTATGVLLQS